MLVPGALALVALLQPPTVDPWFDGALTLGAVGGWAGLHLAHPALVETSCPCAPDGINAFDRVALGNDFPHAEPTADALAATTMALAVTLPLLISDEWGDALLVAESMAITGLLTQTAKILFGRPFPYMHGPAPYPEQNGDGVNYAAFWSGHTAVPMAGAVTLAYTYQARRPRGRWRWVLWTVGPALALTAGALQIAAENHYPSDVLVGGAVGAGVGLVVPWLHRF